MTSPAPLNAPRDTLGRPLRDLRVSVIETCNYRCPYCMPEASTPAETALDRARRLDFDQIEAMVAAFVAQGVRKVRLTGGEPLLRKDLHLLVRRLARMPGIEDLALTTNASLLADKAAPLRAAGLRRLTVSLDAIDAGIFRAMSGGRGELSEVLEGIRAAEAAGFTSIKFNAVIQRGVNEDQVLPLVERFRGTAHVLRFIEYMDVGSCNGWRAQDVLPTRELLARIHARWPLRPLQAGYRGEVASRHGFVDGAGEIGFVSSVSEPFCGDCHRARLSADGQLFTCLFASRGADLRPALEQGPEALQQRIAALWGRRADRYSELRGRDSRSDRRIEMFYIGG